MRVVAAAVVGAVLVALAATAADIPLSERRSGYEMMAPELRAMQDDETANPGMLAVIDGEALWRRPPAGAGPAAKSCAGCHGEDARVSMQGVAARYPAFDPTRGRVLDLEQRINLCRTDHQHVTPLPFDSRELLALTAYVAHQSKGQKIAIPDADPQTGAHIAAGRAIFARRQGQLNLSCALCHDANWGKRLGGATIPQGHPTGYPIYRLEWQGMGSLSRRLRDCLTGMRAAPYPDEAPEIDDLELYLAWRARGMKIDAPAVRP
jgi:L-cysteine S-thiosulfotransferase